MSLVASSFIRCSTAGAVVCCAMSACESSKAIRSVDQTKPTKPFDPSAVDMTYRSSQSLPTTRRTVRTLDSTVVDRPIAVGTLPLVYLVGSAGTVRIEDVDAKRSLASSSVSHNSTVAVDATRGVIVDGGVVSEGPLDATHRYGIFYSVRGGGDAFITATETNDPSILRDRTFGTKSATQSSTAPALSRP